MTYKETTEYLYNQLPVYQKVGGSAYKEGLDNSRALDTYFSHPHTQYKTIHVAGTNGKGSTSHLLAAILQEAGYKVGLYTSPHLIDFRERIRVNGEKISEQYVVNFVEQHREAYEPIQPSFFELTMMMAFKYFADMKVDIAVIEVGLGGRLDSTNIITPILSVITNISFDHMQFLGNTLEKIAIEKAGIIKKDVPVIIGEAKGEVRTVFDETAKRVGTPIIFAEDEHIIRSKLATASGWLLDTKYYSQLKGELSGYAQLKNAATVLCAVKELQRIGYTIPSKSVYNGFAYVTKLTGLMGRWQVVHELNPKIVCDTGHNVAGMEYIVKQLAHEKYNTLHVVLGMVNDKDVNAVLSMLPKKAIYYFTKASIPRAMNERELQKLGQKQGLTGYSYQTVAEAIRAAKDWAAVNDFIFVGGSNFIVADALIALGYK
ncbi:bifunctional folylpolyglutamate synthase/dihydrofolate synthase [Dysgonomonas sp. Marseille-P4677]|uniref:bifunctional folylpolyglutamate synthase/dihydrofolate synthase n=1 Tax=Dysgonomonas sp. Marseille-P4677 TaxID=2364790 RepID=UPI0019147F40|nr:folylpolyglutamate synthase/dihydrofolate synthase family protein [Dysgonomonas sp. Marseille-P4677]MBK5721288.1 bifunctional folylpolyglutamate synthase/dihydrofolate synthase [Dysgonomonas sp. Marseille-P4677]